MALQKVKTGISVEECLASEMLSPTKREFVEGEIYAKAGSNDNHNRSAGVLFTQLLVHLRGLKYEPFFSDIKVWVTRNVYYYPDILVSYAENPEHPYFRNNSILIIEVASPSTERIDRREKLLYYQQMPSPQEYVIVDQHRMNVEVHRRQPNGGWKTVYFNEPNDVVELTSVDLSIPLPELYRRVRFEQDADRHN